jgi:hypothetical protein
MTLALVFTLMFLALLGYGLQRNARRQTGPKPPLAGSTDVPDRDLQRIRAELAAVNGRGESGEHRRSRDLRSDAGVLVSRGTRPSPARGAHRSPTPAGH